MRMFFLTGCLLAMLPFGQSQSSPKPIANTICDLGGPFVDRGVPVSGNLERLDLAPTSLATNEAVETAFSGLGLDIASGLVARIYTFYNEPDGQLAIANSLPDSTLGFVFQCEYNDLPFGGNPEVYLGTFSDFTTEQALPEGIYYFVVVSLREGMLPRSFEFTPFPTCTNAPQVDIGLGCTAFTKPTPTDFTEYSDRFSVSETYSACYDGSRQYEGPDILIAVSSPGTNNFFIASDAPIGVFTLSDLCGDNCLRYQEMAPGDSVIAVEIDQTLSGPYYLVIDTEASDIPTDVRFYFPILNQCRPEFDVPFFVSDFFALPLSNSRCRESDSASKMGHAVDVPYTAFDSPLRPNDYVFWTFQDKNNQEVVLNQKNANASISLTEEQLSFQLPLDDTPDLTCSYRPGDSLRMLLLRTNSRLSETLFRYDLEFAPISPPGITDADGTFNHNARSVVTQVLQATPSVQFGLHQRGNRAPIQSGALGGDYTFPLITNAEWEVIIPDTSGWISCSTLSGMGPSILKFQVATNSTPFDRESLVTIRLKGVGTPVRTSMLFKQTKNCGTFVDEAPIQEPICEGAFTELPNPFVFDSKHFQTEWYTVSETGERSPLFYDRFPSFFAGPAGTKALFQATITSEYCPDTITFNYEFESLSRPVASSALVTDYCQSESLPLLAEPLEENVTYDWYTEQLELLVTDTNQFQPVAPGSYLSRARRTDLESCLANDYRVHQLVPQIQLDSFRLRTAASTGGKPAIQFFLSGGTPPYQIRWLENGQERSVSGAMNTPFVEISGLALGTYQWELDISDQQGCERRQLVEFEVDQTVSVEPLQESTIGITVFPNPSTGPLVLRHDRGFPADADWTLLSVQGQEVAHYGSTRLRGQKSIAWQLPSLPAGYYILRYRSSDQQALFRIIRL